MFERSVKIHLFGASLVALSLAGCAAGINTTIADINALSAALTTPAAAQAIANLKALGQGVVCGVGPLVSLTGTIASYVKATATVQGAQIALMTTNAACLAAGGTVVATATPSPTALAHRSLVNGTPKVITLDVSALPASNPANTGPLSPVHGR
jgi:hypothetical protein